MRVIRTTDTTENICNTCQRNNEFPLCCPNDAEFGSGKENDNIIACSQCLSNYSKTIYQEEISKEPRKQIFK